MISFSIIIQTHVNAEHAGGAQQKQKERQMETGNVVCVCSVCVYVHEQCNANICICIWYVGSLNMPVFIWI